MKKIISLFMVLTMVLSLAACSTNQSPSESTPEESSSQTNESTPTPSNTNGKNLVVYFSMPDNVDDSTVVIDGETLGNTQYMAYVIQETVGADIFRIEPETPYPTDHDELVDLASEEQSNNARPQDRQAKTRLKTLIPTKISLSVIPTGGVLPLGLLTDLSKQTILQERP